MFKRWFIIGALLCFVGALAFAQDTREAELELFSTQFVASYVFTQRAASGELVALEDGNYQLILSEVGEDTNIVQVNPPNVLSYSNIELAADWSDAAESGEVDEYGFSIAEVEAKLEFDGQIVYMYLNGAEYDEIFQTMTYTGFVYQYIPSLKGIPLSLDDMETDIAKSVPTAFEAPTLTLSASDLFWSGLAKAAEQRIVALRDPSLADCGILPAQMSDLRSQLAAIDPTPESRPELLRLQSELNYLDAWYTANCQP